MGKGSRSSAGALTYADAGVDIDAGERAAALIKPLAASTRRPEVVGGVGFFGGLFQLGGYANPVLVSSTDSVGTKVLLAIQMGRFDTIGIDLVNHCANDIFVGGAEPLFFLDYIGLGKLDPEQVERLVMGVASACRDNNCALVGGETAELPGLYKRGDFDLVGFIVGAVERDRRHRWQRHPTRRRDLGPPVQRPAHQRLHAGAACPRHRRRPEHASPSATMP